MQSAFQSYPRVPSVDKNLRSKSRKLVFTIKQLGAMVAYADQEPCVHKWLQLMIATAARPDAALAFVPANQWLDSVIDLHPPGAPVTDKRNPIVPAITPLTYVMKGWKLDLVTSRKRWWRTMRTKLNIPTSYVPKPYAIPWRPTSEAHRFQASRSVRCWDTRTPPTH
jgi:hypothetical protein